MQLLLKQKEQESEKQNEEASSDTKYDEGHLTKAQKIHMKRMNDKLEKDMEKILEVSHRERVNKFNEKLGSLTEHNDIPRVSAAGNG